MRMRRGRFGSAALAVATAVGCASTAEEAEGDWREEPHHLSLFTGSTMERDESALATGVDYEYRVSDFLGVGAVVERTAGDIDALLVLAAFDLHVTNSFVIQTGPGIDFIDDEEHEFVYRLGMLYEWELGDGYTLSPQVHYDWSSDEDAYVVGLAVGRAF